MNLISVGWILTILAIFGNGDSPARIEDPTPNIMRLEPGSKSPPATIDDVEWIAGNWQGNAMGGVAEETWSLPRGRSMMGMFRLFKGGDVLFYEFFTISEEKGSLILKLKHFHPDLKGWEEKDDYVSFPLVKLGAAEIYFDGMTYRKTADKTLQVLVSVSREDGTVDELEFVYERVTNSR